MLTALMGYLIGLGLAVSIAAIAAWRADARCPARWPSFVVPTLAASGEGRSQPHYGRRGNGGDA